MRTSLVLLFLFSTALLHSQTPRLVVPIGHTDQVVSVAFSPDGKTVLTGSNDQKAKLWDLDGHEIQTFSGHSAYIVAVDFSPDGKTILTGACDKTAKLWNLEGTVLRTFAGHRESLTAAVFAPNGKTILTGSNDSTAILWGLDGHKLHTFTGHNGGVTAVAFSSDGKTILTGSNDSTAILWDLEGRILQTFSGHTNQLASVAFSPDGTTILTGSWDGTAKLWNFDGSVKHTFAAPADELITAAIFSPDGKTILTGCTDHKAQLWDLKGHEIQTFSGHTHEVVALAFSPDGKMLLTGCIDNTAKIWNLDGSVLRTLTGYAHHISSVAYAPDGKSVVTGSFFDHTAKLWNLTGREMYTLAGHDDWVSSVAISPDSKSVLTGSHDNTAKLWDLRGHEIKTFAGHDNGVTSVIFSPDGKTVLTSSWDSTAKLWNLQGRELHTFAGHTSPVASVAFSPDGKTVLTGSWDETAKLWDLQGRDLYTFTGHANGLTAVAFSPNGNSILTSSFDNTAKLWDLEGHSLYTFTGHVEDSYFASSVSSAVFSPDGKTVLTGGSDHRAKLWDLQGRELRSFTGHAGTVSSAVFSPDGKIVLTGSADQTAKLWDTNTGQTLATIVTLGPFDWVVTTPSGLFDASPGAMRLMYFVVNREVIELEQLKERYYEPGLLAKLMGFSDEPLREVEGFDSVALYPAVQLKIDSLQNKLNIRLHSRSGGIGKVSVFVNGKEIIEEANPPKGFEKIRDTAMTIDLEQYARYFLIDSLNTISIRAYNKAGWLKSAAQNVQFRSAPLRSRGTGTSRGAAPQLSDRKPGLYVLCVGASNYAGDQIDLKYSAKDAGDMASAMQQIGSKLFRDSVFIQLLTTDTTDAKLYPTRENIKAAFEDIKSRAKAEDVLVVYFSGHGVAYNGLFYYLTMEAASFNLSDDADAGVLAKRTVSSEELTRWINDIPAQKQVLILDACNSGKVVENLAAGQKSISSSQMRALDRMKDRTGMFVLTGSAADMVSYEAGQYGQGLLTYSVLQGMTIFGSTGDHRIDVMNLFQHARDEVPLLAKGIGGIQTPMLVGPLGGSFDIGIADSTVRIPVAQVKPVFIRNVFLDENSFNDDLGLARALEGHFQQLTARGAQAKLIYVDVSEYENAYAVRGLYSIDGETVTVRGRLFQGKNSKGAYRVTGKKDNVPALVQAILAKVTGML